MYIKNFLFCLTIICGGESSHHVPGMTQEHRKSISSQDVRVPFPELKKSKISERKTHGTGTKKRASKRVDRCVKKDLFYCGSVTRANKQEHTPTWHGMWASCASHPGERGGNLARSPSTGRAPWAAIRLRDRSAGGNRRN